MALRQYLARFHGLPVNGGAKTGHGAAQKQATFLRA